MGQKMTYDVSLLIPGIRTHQWKDVIETFKASCTKYSWEVVFSGPFDLPPELAADNVKYIKTYANPSVSAQLGAEICSGRLILHEVDDAHFIPGAVDAAVDLYNSVCGYKDVVNCRYTEDAQFSGASFKPEFWYAHTHVPLRLVGIPTNYKLALHFMINRQYFMELGGLDCSYEYLNLNLHDLMFRVQYDGGKIYDSPTDVTNCNHYEGRSVDHGPIHDAYGHDIGLFTQKYSNPQALHPGMTKIAYDNWRSQPEVWGRRFKKKYASYEEMMENR